MSSVDTAKTADLIASLDVLAAALRADAASLPTYRTTMSESYHPVGTNDYVDVRSFAERLIARAISPAIVSAADGVAKTADRAVSRSFASPDLTGNAHGVSVFLPLELTEDTLAAYRVSRMAHASQWDELVAWLNNLQ
jgi:hypothetical protein